jgi:hypothetical protein
MAIQLNDEYTFCAVYAGGELSKFTIGDAGGGRDSSGWHPGSFEDFDESMVAAVNQYGEVFWKPGVVRDYQSLANLICGLLLWDGDTYICRDLGYRTEYFYPEVAVAQ